MEKRKKNKSPFQGACQCEINEEEGKSGWSVVGTLEPWYQRLPENSTVEWVIRTRPIMVVSRNAVSPWQPKNKPYRRWGIISISILTQTRGRLSYMSHGVFIIGRPGLRIGHSFIPDDALYLAEEIVTSCSWWSILRFGNYSTRSFNFWTWMQMRR